MTEDERIRAYRRMGYTAVFRDGETGELIPGHTDLTIADALDDLDVLHGIYYDDLGQAYAEVPDEQSN